MSLPGRIVETVVPDRLGRPFRWLLASAVITNAGDGIAIAAGPLLVASLTRDPFLVSMALLAEFLPSLLFGVLGGALADRFDRKRMVVAVNLGRAFVLVVFASAIVTGTIDIALTLAALFVLGTAEVFADSASSTLIPRLVPRQDYGIANARMQGAYVLVNQLVAPPIGAFVFALGMALPFVVNAACFGLGAVLITRIVADTKPEARPRQHIATEMIDGLRWLLGNPPMRTLALTVLTFNVAFGATYGVLVLYAMDRLGMDEVGFGLLTTATAAGGIIGTLIYGRLERRFSFAKLMRVGLLIETGTHLTLALTTIPAVALVTLVVFGVHEFVWGTISTVIRQRAVPDALLGRVGGVYRVAIVGGLVVGIPIGGILARTFGITSPFWYGFVVSAALVVLLWREFEKIAHAGEA